MAWTYVVPAAAFEALAVQLPAHRRREVLERARIEVHAEVTRRLFHGQGPGSVPAGLLTSGIDSFATPTSILLTGTTPLREITSRPPRGRLKRTSPAPRAWAKSSTEAGAASGPEWVYPGNAAGGVFRDAVNTVRLFGDTIVQELLAK